MEVVMVILVFIAVAVGWYLGSVHQQGKK